MAISVDWATKIVTVPESYLTPVQTSPSLIYSMELNAFRLELSALLDDEEGMPYVDIYQHNTTVTLSGLEYARIIEIINGYTITFEDGQYAVNLIGANSNVQDNVNVNQVSVRSSNSAGMTSSAAIEYASYGGGVWIDAVNGESGQLYPIGTVERPVDNLYDAHEIAEIKGFTKFFFKTDFTFSAADQLNDGYEFVGEGSHRTVFTFETGCLLTDASIIAATCTGLLDGPTAFEHCLIRDLGSVGAQASSVPLLLHNCFFEGEFTVPSNYSGVITAVDCWALPDTLGAPPVINFGGSNADFQARNWSGLMTLTNVTNIVDIRVFFVSGGVTLDSSVTSGDFLFKGIGNFVDNSTSFDALDKHGLITNETIATHVWDDILTGQSHNIPTSAGRRLRALSSSIVYEETAQGPGIGGNQIVLDTGAASYNGAYDPSMISIVVGTGAGQTRNVLEYDGASRTATVDRDWKILPDDTSEFVISANAGREHVNEGLAQGGTISTITLNANASSIEGSYVGQVVFLRSGTAQDQAQPVIAYDGATKVATLEHDWHTAPDSTTAYVMLPYHTHVVEHIARAVWDDTVGTRVDGNTTITRKQIANKAVISADDLTVTIYDDDGTTPLYLFDISADKRTRTPQ
jgi:hypothetical protein